MKRDIDAGCCKVFDDLAAKELIVPFRIKNICTNFGLRFRENVDLAALMIRSKPYHDNEELLSICYRCSTTNPLHNPKGGNRY